MVGPGHGTLETMNDQDGPQPAQPKEGPAVVTTTLTHVLEDLVPIPGTRLRVGLDPVLSLIPWAGSIVGGVFGTFLVFDAVRLRMPIPVLVRMLGNWTIDWAVGLVPYAGPLFDAAWRSNAKNLKLLNRTIADREQVRRATVWYWITAASVLGAMLALLFVVPVVLLAWLFSRV